MDTHSSGIDKTVEIGGYRPVTQITKSPVASLYKAIGINSTRAVALPAGRALKDDAANSVALENMVNTARSLKSINHPNIVPILDAGNDGDWSYVASHWVDQSLAEALAGSDPVSIREAAAFTLTIAQGLAAAHASGLIHSALTTSNILITEREIPHIADFGGLALSSPESRAAYISPEQASGQRPGPRSDIYSLGCVLYELVAGVPPFRGTKAASLFQKHIREIPKPLEQIRLGVPASLSALVLSCIEKDSRNRPRSIDNVVEDLNDIVIDLKTVNVSTRQSGAFVEDTDGTVATGTYRGQSKAKPEVATGTWGLGPAMSQPRAEHASLTLKDGRILATGGVAASRLATFMTRSRPSGQPQALCRRHVPGTTRPY